jgi:hypothetical protein
MMRIRVPLALLVAAVLTSAPLATPARASAVPQRESVVGVYAAIGCGLGIRATLSGGFASPAIVSVTIGLCALMIADALATAD